MSELLIQQLELQGLGMFNHEPEVQIICMGRMTDQTAVLQLTAGHTLMSQEYSMIASKQFC